MTLNDYLKILLNGHIEDSPNLKSYLIRNQKTAERDSFVKYDEFYHKCCTIIGSLKKECDRRMYERKRELYLIIGLCKNNNEPFKEITDEIQDLTPNMFPITLHMYTHAQFTGHLYYDEIQYFENVINERLCFSIMWNI
jgi:hypothetical protein